MKELRRSPPARQTESPAPTAPWLVPKLDLYLPYSDGVRSVRLDRMRSRRTKKASRRRWCQGAQRPREARLGPPVRPRRRQPCGGTATDRGRGYSPAGSPPAVRVPDGDCLVTPTRLVGCEVATQGKSGTARRQLAGPQVPPLGGHYAPSRRKDRHATMPSPFPLSATRWQIHSSASDSIQPAARPPIETGPRKAPL